jgi:hypothetical protein
MSQTPDLDDILSTNRQTIVFFYRSDSPEHVRLLSFVSRLPAVTPPNITVATFDVAARRERLSGVPLSDLPAILAFVGHSYAGTFYGRWTPDEITTFALSFGDERRGPVVFQSPLQVLEFRGIDPVNVIVFAGPGSAYARSFLAALGARAALLPLAFVENEMLAAESGARVFPSFVINRPFDDVQHPAELFPRDLLHRKLRPLITPIRHRVLGSSLATNWTLAALVDCANASHRRIAASIFKHCGAIFGDLVNYQICDFRDCAREANVVGPARGSEPVILALTRSLPIIYREREAVPRGVRVWLRSQMALDRRISDFMTANGEIPSLASTQFTEVVENTSTDSVLLVGNPQSHQRFYRIFGTLIAVKRILEKSPAVKFYRFDPVSQPSAGLKLPVSQELQIIVFPAGDAGMVIVEAREDVDFLLAKIGEHLRAPLAIHSLKKIQSGLPTFEIPQ